MSGRRLALIAAVLGLVAALGVAADAGIRLIALQRLNADADRLAGKDGAVAAGASPILRAARAEFLLKHGRIEEAQTIADGLASQADPLLRAGLLYDLGNAALRRALTDYLSKPVKLTAPLIRFAKAEYREALHLDPQNWDARYNLDVATALVREREFRVPNVGQEMARDRAYRPDTPGAPDGLP